MLKFFANCFWTYLPHFTQKKLSRAFSYFFELKISRLIILPYCLFFDISTEYLDQFESESGKPYYSSYSDFFQRKYKITPNISTSVTWPCEGYLCDWGSFSDKNFSLVKGQNLNHNDIFKSYICDDEDYFFVNIFLHNHNYHRIHSPVDGKIIQITSIPGDLIFLRPWFYKSTDISYPAFRNERIIFEIEDSLKRSWHLAMVGGFGVGTIEIYPQYAIGSILKAGEEFAKFKLGSTVCIASPEPLHVEHYLQKVYVGQTANKSTLLKKSFIESVIC